MSGRSIVVCDRCGADVERALDGRYERALDGWMQAILVSGPERPIQSDRFQQHLDLCPECVDGFKGWVKTPTERAVQG